MSYKAFAKIKEQVELETIKAMTTEDINELLNSIKGEIDRLKEWLEWVSAHSVYECGVPDNSFPYLNMPPNEGAALALKGEKISDFSEPASPKEDVDAGLSPNAKLRRAPKRGA